MEFDKLKKEYGEFIGLIERKTNQLAELGQEAWDTHSPSITKAYDEYQAAAKEYATSTITTAKTSAQGVVDRVMYSSESMNKLQDLVRFQGGY
ncbi:MAG: hypothetical protein P8R37_05980, partial [Opitutae bacterium]|nr:hypothetical protein [Opitutae bacterium]